MIKKNKSEETKWRRKKQNERKKKEDNAKGEPKLGRNLLEKRLPPKFNLSGILKFVKADFVFFFAIDTCRQYLRIIA